MLIHMSSVFTGVERSEGGEGRQYIKLSITSPTSPPSYLWVVSLASQDALVQPAPASCRTLPTRMATSFWIFFYQQSHFLSAFRKFAELSHPLMVLFPFFLMVWIPLLHTLKKYYFPFLPFWAQTWARLPEFKDQLLHWLAMWSYLSFSICKMGIISVPTSQCWCERWTNGNKTFWTLSDTLYALYKCVQI